MRIMIQLKSAFDIILWESIVNMRITLYAGYVKGIAYILPLFETMPPGCPGEHWHVQGTRREHFVAILEGEHQPGFYRHLRGCPKCRSSLERPTLLDKELKKSRTLTPPRLSFGLDIGVPSRRSTTHLLEFSSDSREFNLEDLRYLHAALIYTIIISNSTVSWELEA
jgi:hypothetical protein